MGAFSIPYKEMLDIGLGAVKTRPEGGTFLDKHSWNINFPNLARKLSPNGFGTKSTRLVDDNSWSEKRQKNCQICHKPRFAQFLNNILSSTVATINDHFPKPRSRTWPNSFRRGRWRGRQSLLIRRCWWRRRKLSARNTADLRAFACKYAVGYRAMVTSIMWRRGRSGYGMRLCLSRFASSLWFFF